MRAQARDQPGQVPQQRKGALALRQSLEQRLSLVYTQRHPHRKSEAETVGVGRGVSVGVGVRRSARGGVRGGVRSGVRSGVRGGRIRSVCVPAWTDPCFLNAQQPTQQVIVLSQLRIVAEEPFQQEPILRIGPRAGLIADHLGSGLEIPVRMLAQVEQGKALFAADEEIAAPIRVDLKHLDDSRHATDADHMPVVRPHHAEPPVSFEAAPGQRPVAWLEDMQRQERPRQKR